jgi:hypothetical protein
VNAASAAQQPPTNKNDLPPAQQPQKDRTSAQQPEKKAQPKTDNQAGSNGKKSTKKTIQATKSNKTGD